MTSKRFSTLTYSVLRGSLAMLCGALCLAACTDDELLSPRPGQAGRELRFSVSDGPDADAATRAAATDNYLAHHTLAQTGPDGQPLYVHASVRRGITRPQAQAVTRGNPVANGSFHASFGFLAYAYNEADDFDPQASTPNYLYNVKADRQGAASSMDYAPASTFYLPAEGTDVDFYAYAPYADYRDPSGDQRNLFVPAKTQAGTPSFIYRVPYYSGNQADVCLTAGTTARGGGSGEVALHFRHVLTGIRIIWDKSMPSTTIRRVNLKDFSTTGVYTPPTAKELAADPKANGAWTELDGKDDLLWLDAGTDVENLGIQTTTGTDRELTTATNMFFVIPQTLGDGAELLINPGLDNPTRLTLTGLKLEAGTTVTFRISKQEEDVEFTVEPTGSVSVGSIPWNGGDLKFNVTARQGDQKLDYVIEYATKADAEDKDWVTLWQSNGDQSTNLPAMVDAVTRAAVSGQTYDYTQTIKITETRSTYTLPSSDSGGNLNNKAGGDANNPKGLTNGNSSNCYIVSGYGDFQFESVYGNAKKGGGFNSAVLNGKYKDRDGNMITQTHYRIDPARVEVLWQDVPGLVTNVREHTSGSDHYIRFHVDPSTIQEGNCVIGALDESNRVIWSWHIWVVNGINTVQVTGGDGQPRRVLDRPIGYVRGGTKRWQARTGYLRFRLANETSAASAQVISFALQQSGDKEAKTNGRYTLYQWGRKDPMRPIERGVNGVTYSTVYTNGYNNHLWTSVVTSSMGVTGKGGSIDRPTVFNTNTGGDWQKAYLWNAGANTTATTTQPNDGVTKSIYDPSPQGYKVPPRQTFTGFIGGTTSSANGLSNTQLSQANVNDDIGFRFPKNATSNYIRIPMAGVLLANGFTPDGNIYGKYGYYWTAGKTDATHGNILYFMSQYLVYPPAWVFMFDMYGDTYASGTNLGSRVITNALPILPVAE